MNKRSRALLALLMCLYGFIVLSGMDMLGGNALSAGKRHSAGIHPDQDRARNPAKPFFLDNDVDGNAWSSLNR